MTAVFVDLSHEFYFRFFAVPLRARGAASIPVRAFAEFSA